MLDRSEMTKIARARLEDAEALTRSQRSDGAIYLCGYAVEIALTATICETLHWSGYPSTPSEFQPYQSFKTHDLDVLLHLSGVEGKIKAELFTEWSAVAEWDPQVRYNPVGSTTTDQAKYMIQSSKVLLRAL